MRISFLISVAAICVEGEYIRHHKVVGPKPQPVEFHGFLGMDLDGFRPPEHEPAFDELREKIEAIEKEEQDRINHQLSAVHKAEKAFLESDLHKEAVGMKLFHIPGPPEF